MRLQVEIKDLTPSRTCRAAVITLTEDIITLEGLFYRTTGNREQSVLGIPTIIFQHKLYSPKRLASQCVGCKHIMAGECPESTLGVYGAVTLQHAVKYIWLCHTLQEPIAHC